MIDILVLGFQTDTTRVTTLKLNNDQLPVILRGGAGGQPDGGRALDYSGESERQLCRLFLSMMDKMNVCLETFGDAANRLEEV